MDKNNNTMDMNLSNLEMVGQGRHESTGSQRVDMTEHSEQQHWSISKFVYRINVKKQQQQQQQITKKVTDVYQL